MKIIDLPSDFIIRDFQEKDYDEIVRFWQLTDLGNPDRGDTIDTIRRTLDLGGKLLVLQLKTEGQICGTSWMTYDGRRIMIHHLISYKQSYTIYGYQPYGKRAEPKELCEYSGVCPL